VPFKIVYLDEADALTRDAQHALRRTMENYANSCRFILSVNYSSKIIDPIQSRCTAFRFRPLEERDVSEIIKMIAKNERLDIDSKTLKTLYEVSEGDVRRVENILQSCSVISKKIDDEVVYNLVSAARPKEVREMLNIAISGNFLKSREMLLDLMLKYGLSGLDVVKQIQKEIWQLKIDDRIKIALVDKCGEIEFRMVEGSDEYIQLETLLANFVKNG
jgi:replication factor C small subunit